MQRKQPQVSLPPPAAPNSSVTRIKPEFYIHVLDSNTNITRVIEGPMVFTRRDHERLVSGPTKMIMIPPRHYAVIKNPRVLADDGTVAFTPEGAVRLRHGDEEIRFHSNPFPLYPGEVLSDKGIVPLQVVNADSALLLRCTRDFDETTASSDPKAKPQVVKRVAGDEWLFKGPSTYTPRVEVQVVEALKSIVVSENCALKIRAKVAFTDRKGVRREAGEHYLWRETGSFLPDVNEEVLGVLRATVLTDRKALHLRATNNFTDVFKNKRNAGEEWLVTIDDASTHIPDVFEQVVGEVSVTTLNNRQYCVVVNPVINGKQHFGQREQRKGECSFFLKPGESLERGIQPIVVLGEEEALLLTALQDFEDGKEKRKAGDRWMVRGPRDYIPPIYVKVLQTRRTIPLDQNEGVYVRNLKTGRVSAVVGRSYMLGPDEDLYAKPIPAEVEALLQKQGRDQADVNVSVRDPTRVVSYRAPHNSAVQVYDYKLQKARVIFGPELVMLAPDEEFTVLSLSGRVPKQSNQIKSIALLLGPDFMTDVTIVETSDHARLSLKLSYNWHFDVGKEDDEEKAQQLFSVPDFVGDVCKAVASMVRGAVASSTFDDFHKHSAHIIRSAVFGLDENGKVNDKLIFSSNRLVITNIDIQSVEPVDQRTRDALQKSVQLAIEITTSSQEASARHEAERNEQIAKGRLERQRINDEAEAENSRMALVQLQAQSAQVEAAGEAVAAARARTEAKKIEFEAAVTEAKNKAQAARIKVEGEIAQLRARQQAEYEAAKKRSELEIEKAKKIAEVETKKTTEMVDALSQDVLIELASAGSDAQVKLLQSLGIQSCLITDGNSPVNLFNTAEGMVAQSQQDQ